MLVRLAMRANPQYDYNVAAEIPQQMVRPARNQLGWGIRDQVMPKYWRSDFARPIYGVVAEQIFSRVWDQIGSRVQRQLLEDMREQLNAN